MAILERVQSNQAIIQKMLDNNIFDRKSLLNLQG